MPIEVVPNRIELSTLTGGFSPDAAEAAVSLDASPEVSNLLPEPWGSELRLRAGFARLTSGRISSLNGYWIRHVYYYELVDGATRKRYLMAVLTNGTDGSPNNVQIWAYNLTTDAFTRVDTADRQWAKANYEHWAAVIEGTYYGGTKGEEIYSWHPTHGWDADPTLPTADTWVNSTSPGAGEKARDYAFRKGDDVYFAGDYYKANRDIRFQIWASGEHYNKGEKVSNKVTISGETYWRSWECTSSHNATSAKSPGDGADTTSFWKRVKLENIKDDDGDLTKDWSYNPVARKSPVGAYHGNRLFIRADDDDNWSRVQYSAPAQPERDSEIADLSWDPTDWSPDDGFSGGGGGWFDVPFSGQGDQIRAFQSYGNYLIIAGRWQTYVLAGTNESTWSLRKLGNYGCISVKTICELDGLVYMLGRHGVLTMTDGTAIQPVPGMEKIRKWMKGYIDDAVVSGDTNWFPSICAHDGRLWISIPDDNATSHTLVYDPRTQSFWEVNIPILAMDTGELGGTARMFFSTAITGAASQYPCIFQYKDDPGDEVYTDDDYAAASASASTDDISWKFRTGWFQYGMVRAERRVRRVWAKIGGEAASTVLFNVYKNFNTGSAETAATRTLTGQATREAEFIESKVGQSGHVAHSTALKVSGTANAAVSLHAFGIDTERVRTRFKRG